MRYFEVKEYSKGEVYVFTAEITLVFLSVLMPTQLSAVELKT